MAASIDIVCPECKKELKGPAELVGKKIRCKSCGGIFVVAAPKAVASRKSASAAAAPAKPAAPDYRAEDREGKNPYKLSDIVRTSRCPQCAYDMEEGDIICLHCGYNTQTRMRMGTVKVYETTATDRIGWLTPGVLCVLAILILIGVIIFLWIPAGLPRLANVGDPEKAAWWGHFSLRIYGTVGAAALGWWCGKFAFKRLILHPTPPDKLKR